VTVDVTNAFANGPGPYTLAIKSDSPDKVMYASREHPEPGVQPVLRVEWEPATSTTIPSSTVTTTTATSTTITTTTMPAPLAFCGDGVVNRPEEECDGSDGTCPATCREDCTCALGVVTAEVEADVYVALATPDTNFGASPALHLDNNPARYTFFRMRVDGLGNRGVASARLHLVASTVDTAGGPGGRLRRISDCTWDESTVTWATRPAIVGAVLETKGAVAPGNAVVFDVTSEVGADGVYCFALEPTSANGVQYDSRESNGGGPTFVVEAVPSSPP
jgi:hypothetical protein